MTYILIAAIVGAGLTVGTVSTANSDTVPAGAVISQNPTAGSTVAPGSAVDLLVSLGPAPVGDSAPPTCEQTLWSFTVGDAGAFRVQDTGSGIAAINLLPSSFGVTLQNHSGDPGKTWSVGTHSTIRPSPRHREIECGSACSRAGARLHLRVLGHLGIRDRHRAP